MGQACRMDNGKGRISMTKLPRLMNENQFEEFLQPIMKEIFRMQSLGISPYEQTAYLARCVFSAESGKEGEEVVFTTSQLKRIFFLSGKNTVKKCAG